MRRSPLAVIFLTIFLDLIGFGIVLPLLPGFARQPHHAADWQVGLLMATYSLMQFFFAPVWGRLSDRIGRRPVLLFSIAGSAVSYLLFAFAPNLPMLFLSRLVAGIMAANMSTAQAYVADVTPPEHRAKGMGMVGAAFGLGFVFGPAIGGLLSRGPNAQLTVGLVAAGFSLFDLLLASVALKESLTPELRAKAVAATGTRLGRMASALRNPELGIPILIFFLSTVAWSQLEPTAALLSHEQYGFNASQTGFMFAYVGIVVALIQGGLAGRMAKRSGEARMVLMGTLFLCIGLAYSAWISGGFGDGIQFTTRDLKNPTALAERLRVPRDPVSVYVRVHLSPETEQLLLKTADNPNPTVPLREELVRDFNRLLHDDSFYQKDRFKNVPLSAETQNLLATRPTGKLLERVNRTLLETAFHLQVGRNPFGLFIALAILGIGQAISMPGLQSLISRRAAAEAQGSTLGVSQGFSSLARAVGPALGGLLFGVRHSYPFWLGAALMVVAFLLAGKLRPSRKELEASQPAGRPGE